MHLVHSDRRAPSGGERPAFWFVYRSRQMDTLRRSYNCRRLIDASERAGFPARIVHPDVAGPEFLAADSAMRPLAMVARSGTKMGRSGKQLLALGEASGVLSLPSLRTLELAESKYRAALTLAALGVPTPLTLPVTAEASTDWLGDVFGFPLVLKNAMGSKGREVRLCETPLDFQRRFAQVVGKGPVLAQRYVRSSHGRDLRVIVVGGEAVGAMVRLAQGDQLCSNVSLGATAHPTPITPEIASIASAAASTLDLEIAGVDLLFDDTGLIVCEVNTAPGLEMIEQVTGRDIAGAMVAHMRDCLTRTGRTVPMRAAAR